MGKTLSSIQEYATIAFTLLGILFGMLIIAFIFGQLGKENISALDDDSITSQRTNAYINVTNYTIPEAANSNFNGGFVVVTALNRSDGLTIAAGNYTANAAKGILYKTATGESYKNVTLTYTFSQKTNARMRTEATNNNSLNAVESYTINSSSQFTTLSLAIILVILIGVFLLFWKIFVANKKSKENSGYGGNFE
jgi:hypothetical protein